MTSGVGDVRANRIADRILEEQRNKKNALADDPAVRLLVQALASRIAEIETAAADRASAALSSFLRRIVPRWQGPLPSTTVLHVDPQQEIIDLNRSRCKVTPSFSIHRSEFRPLTDVSLRRGGVLHVHHLSEKDDSVVELACGSDLTGPPTSRARGLRPGETGKRTSIVLQIDGQIVAGDRIFVEGDPVLLRSLKYAHWRICRDGRVRRAVVPAWSSPSRTHAGGYLGSQFGFSPLRYPGALAARYESNIFDLEMLADIERCDPDPSIPLPNPLATLIDTHPEHVWIWIEMEMPASGQVDDCFYGFYRNWFIAADQRIANFPKGAKGAVLPYSERIIRLCDDNEYDKESFFDLLQVRTWETRGGTTTVRDWRPGWSIVSKQTPRFDISWTDTGLVVHLSAADMPETDDLLVGYQVTYAMTGGDSGNGIERGELTQFSDKDSSSRCKIFNLLPTSGGRPPLATESAIGLVDNWIRTGFRPLSPWDVEQFVAESYAPFIRDVAVEWGPVLDRRRYTTGLRVTGTLRSEMHPTISREMLESECCYAISSIIASPVLVNCKFTAGRI